MKKLISTLILLVGIWFVTIPIYNGCNTPEPVQKCTGYTNLHPWASQVYCYTSSELYHLENEKDPQERVKKFVIRFGILPLRNGKTIFQDLQDTFLIPPAIKAAQAIIEAAITRNHSMSTLAIRANNYHGIKARKGQDFISFLTTEYRFGKKQIESAKFARYDTPYMGMKAHARLLSTGKAYKEFEQNLISPDEYLCMIPERRLEYLDFIIEMLGKYATSPRYQKDLKNTIRKYDLHFLWKKKRLSLPPLQEGHINV